MAAGTVYTKRYAGGFVNLPSQTTPVDQTFLNAVESALLQLLGSAPSADGQVMQWDFANTRYGPALLLNKNIDPAAAIAKSKLDFTGANAIVDGDIAGAAAIAKSKLALTAAITQADMAAGNKITQSAFSGGPPASPTTGDIWLGTAAGASGEDWMFVYNGGSASTYKWEFIGGSPVLAAVFGGSFTADGTYKNDASTLLTAGRAGEYFLQGGISGAASSSGLQTINLTWARNSVSTGTAFATAVAAAASYGYSMSFQGADTLTAGMTASLSYSSNGTGLASTAYRYFSMIPRRIS